MSAFWSSYRYFARVSLKDFVAPTMFFIESIISGHPLVLSPQSGLPQTFSRGKFSMEITSASILMIYSMIALKPLF